MIRYKVIWAGLARSEDEPKVEPQILTRHDPHAWTGLGLDLLSPTLFGPNHDGLGPTRPNLILNTNLFDFSVESHKPMPLLCLS